MPVVTNDWMWPSAWLRARTGWGIVRDGDTLRLARIAPGGKPATYQIPVLEWREGHPVAEKLRADRKKGGILVAGLPPHRVLSRRLVSPLRDPGKTREIWPALFDAAIPYPLDRCHVAFLPLREDGEGSACLAAGIRDSDLDEALAEWAESGIHPDLLVPESLALCGHGESRVWMGRSRTVWSLWEPGGFRGVGGARARESHEKIFSRQRAALDIDTDPQAVGPDTEVDPDLLEVQLARCARRPDPYAVNLLAGERASPSARTRWERARRNLRGVGLFALLLLCLLPFFLPHLVWMRSEQTEREALRLFEGLTGRPPPPAGQAAVRARQILASEAEPLRRAINALERPVVGAELVGVLDLAKSRGILLSRVDLEADRFRVRAVGSEAAVTAWAEGMEASGWSLKAPTMDADAWVVEGER